MRALVLLVLMGAFPAAAQSHAELVRRLVPLEVGNEWSYARSYTFCDHVATGGGCTTTDTTLVYTVVGERVVGGDTLAVIEGPGTVALLGFAYGETRVIREVIEGDGGQYFAYPPIPYDFPEFFLRRGVSAEDVEVGGSVYALSVLGGYVGAFHLLGLDVGPLRYESDRVGSGGVRWTTTYRLAGARVGGRTYGSYATPAEPAPRALAVVTVWPNPATDWAAVSVELAAPADLRVDLIDGLGRVVATRALAAPAGARDLRLEFGELPPGVYAVRVLSGGALVGTARVTKGR